MGILEIETAIAERHDYCNREKLDCTKFMRAIPLTRLGMLCFEEFLSFLYFSVFGFLASWLSGSGPLVL